MPEKSWSCVRCSTVCCSPMPTNMRDTSECSSDTLHTGRNTGPSNPVHHARSIGQEACSGFSCSTAAQAARQKAGGTHVTTLARCIQHCMPRRSSSSGRGHSASGA